MEPQEVAGVWGWVVEYLRIVGKSQGAFLRRQGLGSRVGYNSRKILLVALNVCTAEFVGDALSSLRVVQVYIHRYDFCHREWS